MRLPVAPPLAPMLSRAVDALPGGAGWKFEPKWDASERSCFGAENGGSVNLAFVRPMLSEEGDDSRHYLSGNGSKAPVRGRRVTSVSRGLAFLSLVRR